MWCPLTPGVDQRDPEAVFWPIGLWEAWGTKAKKAHLFTGVNQRDPEAFVWPSGLLDAWGTKAKNHTSSGK